MKTMNKEDKQLSLKDFLSRLFYGVKIKLGDYDYQVEGYDPRNSLPLIVSFLKNDTKYYVNIAIKDYCPYLRSMSSMTEKEIEDLKTLCSIYIPTDSHIIGFEDYGISVFTHHLTNNTYSFKLTNNVIDWLDKNMFDYRGLIKKGLALEAPKGMYN